MHHAAHDSLVDACVRACSACAAVCERAVVEALETGDLAADHRFLRLLLDCIASCRSNADLLTRGLEWSSHSCNTCLVACRDVATSCRERGFAETRACIEACETCAAACAAVLEAGSQRSRGRGVQRLQWWRALRP